MAKPGLRKIHRSSDEFKATAMCLSQLPGVAVRDMVASLDMYPFGRRLKEHHHVRAGCGIDD